MRRSLLAAALTACAFGSASCGVATNLSYGEITAEIDDIVTRQGTGADQRLVYADRAAVSSWYMHNVLTTPLRPVLGFVFGRRSPTDLPNPSGHVRELITAMPWRASDLLERSDAIVRFLTIAELDPNALNRIVALDGMSHLVEVLGSTPLRSEPETALVDLDPEAAAQARTAIQAGRVGVRHGAAFTPEAAESYAQAIEALVRQPLPEWWDRAAWIGDLAQMWHEETDAAVKSRIAAALGRAIGFAVERAIIRAVQGRDPRYANVRLCAMQLFRRHGGPDRVPLLLALMAAPSAGGTKIADRFDPDPTVQLQLIRMCAQLHGEAAEQAVKLPGRESWDAIAPVDYLALTVLGEQTYYSKLRVPAMTALCLCLGRERLDYDVQWVEELVQTRRLKS
ncbi:MAG: hypothetical protein U1E73_14060 [Planctomycetota bacterium]